MKVSHNEILTLCQKSFEGLGFSPGETNDAAEMIALLAVHGMDVLAQVCQALPTLTTESQIPPHLGFLADGSIAVDAKGGSALFWGPLLVEWGVMKAIEDGAAVAKVCNYCHPSLLLGLMPRYARHGVGLDFRWGSAHTWIGPNEPFPTVVAGSRESFFAIEPDSVLTLSFSTNPAEANVELDHCLMAPANFADAFNERRNDGIEIEDAHWATLNRYAKNVLVEATEESRRRGAGEEGR